MFLAALARPRYEPPRKQHWDGKYAAKRRSKNRAKGDIFTRNIDTVDRTVYKNYLLTKVFPAIKEK
ncbi:hypothetical protein L915_16504 [Phytophthora nicotianae]|uniref:Uncharacterized protein n=2 Tax=Phytophthora nicotianae TaxID=4792 RepID=W2HQG6_PHYNI|nr:hypothetical protein L915_16504 [Phytophthora nicotianae]ETL24219.1 hypothetical protein L916_21767 [Phytophthora nicotianae]ETM37082.1 hypothetical protein L914_16339 [Phytophthora nicotianae]ETO65734.1 hypothetical protein F444_16999 [Phytophthora nicotianae P1976]